MELTCRKFIRVTMAKRFVRLHVHSRTITCIVSLIVIVCFLKALTLVEINELRQSESMENYTIITELSKQEFDTIGSILDNYSKDSGKCTSPSLPLYTELIRNNRPELIPHDLCVNKHSPNWLHVSESRVHFNKNVVGVSCSAEPIVRVDDQTSEFSSAQPIHDGDELPSLGFRATCSAQNGDQHSSVYYGIKRTQLPTRHHAAGEHDNIIMLGTDSLSRMESLRSLQRVSSLMRSEQLNGVTLMQYNILGDGTPAALLPILTGVREVDMPEGRKGFKGAKHLDESMRWLFSDLRDRGFVTLYGEEQSGFGTFQMRFLGFKKEPVDFYLRPALMKQESLQTDGICIGNELASTRMMTTVKDLFTLYPNQPKFAFLFFSTLSHENKDLTSLDSELTNFVHWFLEHGLNANTSLILMSDHGQRHGPMRNSMQGKLEESLPLMTISLSQQLRNRRTNSLQMLRNNAKRLTTPLDIHRTLRSVAGVEDAAAKHEIVRSYSLIDEAVVESRSCSDAGIPTHWCSCLALTRLQNPQTNELAMKAAHFAVNQMNSATKPFRQMCQELHLDSVIEASISLASKDLVRRVRKLNNKNYAHNAEDSSVANSGYISVRLVSAPNNGHYEATVQFSTHRSGDRYSLTLNAIGVPSRINKYGNQASCVENKLPHLRKYCYCRAT